jgi:hypothetical protein
LFLLTSPGLRDAKKRKFNPDCGTKSIKKLISSLPLLVTGILANNPDDPVTANDLAIAADLLH